MADRERSRKEIRDIYESHGIDMNTAVDQESILETGAMDSPAMTGESKEEVDYVNFKGGKSNAGSSAP